MTWLRSFLQLIAMQLNRCTGCYRALKTRQIHIDRLDYLPVEWTEACVHCGSVEDHFAYGAREREYWQYEFEKSHPIYMWFVRLPDRVYRYVYAKLHPSKPVAPVKIGARDETTN